jgi:hypothetical protein
MIGTKQKPAADERHVYGNSQANQPVYGLVGERHACLLWFEATRGWTEPLNYKIHLMLAPITDKPYRSPQIRENPHRRPPEVEPFTSSPKLVGYQVLGVSLSKQPGREILVNFEPMALVFMNPSDEKAVRMAVFSERYGQLKIGEDMKACLIGIDDHKHVFLATIDAVLRSLAMQLTDAKVQRGIEPVLEKLNTIRDLIVLRDGIKPAVEKEDEDEVPFVAPVDTSRI